MPRSVRFNPVVGADLFESNDFGFDAIFLNIICWGIGYPIACSVQDKTSASIAKAFADVSQKHYGMPDLLTTDQGPELLAKEFTINMSNHACLHHVIDSQSPRQQYRTERAGGSLKEDMWNVCREDVGNWA